MKLKKEYMILDKSIKYHVFQGCEYLTEFKERFKKKKEPILVYFDPDVDGLVSGLLACRICYLWNIPFTWYINDRRGHGFLLETEKVKGMGLFCVDFKINSDKLKELVDNGCDVVSMDHHKNGDDFIEYDNGTNRGMVINNQFSSEEEDGRYLSGAGVVFESAVSVFGDRIDTRENRSLVGLTLLTDVRDIENINARLYLQDLYNHPYKGYIKYLIDGTMGSRDYNFGVPRLDRNYVDYTFSPSINSCLRFNRQDDVVEFFLGSKPIDKGYHERQKVLVEKLIEVSRVIEFEALRVVVIDKRSFIGSPDEEFLSSFVGLTASRFLEWGGKRKSVIAYLVSGRVVERASFRGIVNGLDYLSNLLGYLDGEGHGPAFGIHSLYPTEDLFQKCSDVCKKLEESDNTSVSFVTSSNMSMIVNTRAYSMGVENIYCLSQHRKYIKYTGKGIKKKREGDKYVEYLLDGVVVMCFDKDLKPDRDLILPIMERGVLVFYLDRRLG